MSPAWFIIFVLFSFTVSQASVSSQTGGRVRRHEGGAIIRSRRELTCVDGIYVHNNRNCCLCGAGQRLAKHCIVSPDDRKCELCESGKYNSHPNSQMICEPCKSCNHPNANLEERESCKPDSDTKCGCKEQHYCISSTEESCILCHPCKVCGADGIKVTCTGSNDTVCNDKSEGGNQLLTIVLPILSIILVIGIVSGVLWRKKLTTQENITPQINGNATEVELHPLRDVDLLPYMPDIAETLGWKDMEAVAMRSNIARATIDSCKLDHPGDSQEQTLQLLNIWVEQQGRQASGKLIQILQNSGKKGKAEIVRDILSHGRDGL